MKPHALAADPQTVISLNCWHTHEVPPSPAYAAYVGEAPFT